jgi:hypothetical protein
MATLFLTIANGASVSSQGVLSNGDRPFTVYASSVAAMALRIEFAPASGGPFAPLCTAGTGYPTVVVSGSSGWSEPVAPVTPFLRLATAATLAATTSFSIVTVNR